MDWVIGRYYYIINFKYFLRPRIYPVYFVNRAAAKRAIAQNVPSFKERAFYEVIRGKKLKDFEATYVLKLGRLGKSTKYNYNLNYKGLSRKAYRTEVRRRLRRMGMLTNVRSRYKVEEEPGIVKYKRNKQWVANTPDTWATTFQLERKPKKVYYIILKKWLSLRKGFLFKVKVLRVDVKHKTIKKQVINIKRKDIIIPYLTPEIVKLYGKELVARCTAEGVRLGKIEPGIL